MNNLMFAAFCMAASLCLAGEWSLEESDASSAENAEQVQTPSFSLGETDTNHIDVLIVFDASANRWLAGNGRTPDGFAKFCIDDMNASLGYTGISRHFTFRLAGMLDLAAFDLGGYELRDILSGFVPRLAAKSLPHTVSDEIKCARDSHAADVVAILTIGKSPNMYGESEPLRECDMAFNAFSRNAEQAYCAVKIDAIEERHVLLHEIGHILGAGHSDAQLKNPGPQLFPFSSAYRFRAGETPLTTIVGYPEIKDGTILPFFSSPDYALSYTDDEGKTHGGIRVGTPSNDNTRTLLATYRLVAQYRAANPSQELKLFDETINMELQENGCAVNVSNTSMQLSCGVHRTFSLTGIAEEIEISVSGLPPGFKYDAAARTVAGKATKDGRYIALFTFRDKSSGFRTWRRTMFDVAPLPDWVAGNFTTTDKKGRITVSGTGRINVFSRRGYREDKVALDGFTRSETNADGQPFFLCEDGTKFTFETDGNGVVHGVAVGPTGVRYEQTSRKTRKQRDKKRAKAQ